MNRNIRLLGVGVAIRMLGNAIYGPFLALFLVNVLHLSYVDVGIIIVGVGVLQLPFGFLGGLLTDRWGRRNLILVGLAAEAVATAGLAYSFSLESLPGAILAALVGGIITSAAGPATSAYIADFAEGTERTRGFTFYRIGFNAGYSVGVTLGGILISFVGFAGAVATAAAVVGSGAVLLFLTLDPSPREASRSTPVAPPAATDPPGPRPPARTMRESLRMLAKDRVALELLAAFLLGGVVVGQWGITFPLYVHNVLGISYSLLGIGLALNGLVVVFGQQATTESVLGRRHTSIAIGGIRSRRARRVRSHGGVLRGRGRDHFRREPRHDPRGDAPFEPRAPGRGGGVQWALLRGRGRRGPRGDPRGRGGALADGQPPGDLAVPGGPRGAERSALPARGPPAPPGRRHRVTRAGSR